MGEGAGSIMTLFSSREFPVLGVSGSFQLTPNRAIL
jgi:hypothetical protein